MVINIGFGTYCIIGQLLLYYIIGTGPNSQHSVIFRDVQTPQKEKTLCLNSPPKTFIFSDGWCYTNLLHYPIRCHLRLVYTIRSQQQNENQMKLLMRVWGPSCFFFCLCCRVADNTQFNVALPPSTVHLPKMFWVALNVKCHGDTHMWTQRGGAKLSFHRAEVCGGTPLHFMSTHNHKGRGQSGKGKIRMQFKTHNTPTHRPVPVAPVSMLSPASQQG